MTAVTIKSDIARLTMKTRPASLPVASDWLRRLTRCLMVTVVTTTRLPRVPITAATPSTPTYGTATAGFRLYNDPPWPTAVSELFVSISPFSGNSIICNFTTFLFYYSLPKPDTLLNGRRLICGPETVLVFSRR